jgi:hypothetical protein
LWCLDVFDKFVVTGQSVTLGEAVIRRYRPVSHQHSHIVLGIFAADHEDAQVTNFCRTHLKIQQRTLLQVAYSSSKAAMQVLSRVLFCRNTMHVL